MARTTKKAGKARKAPKSARVAPTPKMPKGRKSDPRIPPVGTIMTRTFKGQEIKVEVLDAGFRWDGTTYFSLSALACAITGCSAYSGTAFFGLWLPPAKRAATETAHPAKAGKSVKRPTAPAAPETAPTEPVSA